MTKMIKILLQSTIPFDHDDWNISRFSLLYDFLNEYEDNEGKKTFEVIARDREPDFEGNDPILSYLDQSTFDEVWLFGADVGNGITQKEGEGISRFRTLGKGILTAQDHQDLGMSFSNLGDQCLEIKNSNFYHTFNNDPDSTRCCIDDIHESNISWPNYHSGPNGDYQIIEVLEPVHPVLVNPLSSKKIISIFPSHPHEGGVGISSSDSNGRVIAQGKSIITGRKFNLIVAFEPYQEHNGEQIGPAIVESSFHHFADFNWNPSLGCPSFVKGEPSNKIQEQPDLLDDIKIYILNVAFWLASFNH